MTVEVTRGNTLFDPSRGQRKLLLDEALEQGHWLRARDATAVDEESRGRPDHQRGGLIEVASDLGGVGHVIELARDPREVESKLLDVAEQRGGGDPVSREKAVMEGPEGTLIPNREGHQRGQHGLRMSVDGEGFIGEADLPIVAALERLDGLHGPGAKRALEITEHHDGDGRVVWTTGGRALDLHVVTKAGDPRGALRLADHEPRGIVARVDAGGQLRGGRRRHRRGIRGRRAGARAASQEHGEAHHASERRAQREGCPESPAGRGEVAS